APGPQQDAVVVGVARSDALREQVAAFAPAAARGSQRRTAPGQGGAHRGGQLQELAAVHRRHAVPLAVVVRATLVPGTEAEDVPEVPMTAGLPRPRGTAGMT